MNTKEKTIAYLLLVPLTGFCAYLLFDQISASLNNIVYSLVEDDAPGFLKFETRRKVVFGITTMWIVAQIIFEIAAYFSIDLKYKRLITNLRYAPIAILFISWFSIPIFDNVIIFYSKYQIRNYIFYNSQFIVEPDIRLYSDYRHWCGNGVSAHENYLYFNTASEGINNPNPYARARSLLMMSKVRDSINGGDKRFDLHLANSCRDSDAIVRKTAEKLLNKRESGCEEYLLKTQRHIK